MVDVFNASGAADPSGPKVLANLPEPRVSAQEITAPLQSIARAVGHFGDFIDEATVDLHRQAAENDILVTRDASGKSHVEPRPLELTAGDKAYNAVIRQRSYAQGVSEIDRQITDAAAKHANDPAGFEVESRNLVKGVATSGDKALRGPLSAYADKAASETRNGLVVAKSKSDIATAKADLLSRAEIEISTLRALAQGGGDQTPEYKAQWRRVTDTFGSLASNPAFGFSKERAEQELGRLQDVVMNDTLRPTIDRAFRDGGEVLARETIRKQTTENPNLRVTEQDRSRMAQVLETRLEYLKGQRQGEITIFRAFKTQMLDRIQKNRDVSDQDVDAAVARANALGDMESAAELGAAQYFSRGRIGRADGFESLPDAARRRALGLPASGARPAAAVPKLFDDSMERLEDAAKNRPDQPVTQLLGSLDWENNRPYFTGPDGKPLTARQALAKMRSGESPAPTSSSPPGQGGTVERRASPEVIAAIKGAAGRYGISENLLFRISWIESKFDPNAQHPGSKATGLFQFIPSTWGQYGAGANARDPNANADAAARLLRDNANSLRAALGREPTDGEIYLAHQQGAKGAAALLKNPDARAVDIVGERAVTGNGGTAAMTAGQFAQLWVGKFNGGPGVSVVPGGGYSIRTGGGAPPMPASLAGNPYGPTAFLRSLTQDEDRHIAMAENLATAALNALKHREMMSREDLAFLLQARDRFPDKLGQKVGEVVDHYSATTIGRDLLNGSEVSAMNRLAEAKALAAQSGDLHAQRVLRYATDYVGAGTKAMGEDHIAEGAARGWYPRLGPLDFSSPQAVADSVAGRSVAVQRIFGNEQGKVPVRSMLAKTDADSFAAGLGQAKPAVIRTFFESLLAAPAQVRDATIQDPNVVSALKALARTDDPDRLAVVMTGLSGLKSQNLVKFADAFGQSTLADVQLWDLEAKFLTREELQRRAQIQRDPAAMEITKRWQSEATKEVAAMSPTTVAEKVAHYASDLISSDRFGDRAPQDPEASAAFVGEFANRARAAVLKTRGDVDKAVAMAAEQMSSVWAVSAVNNGTYMRFAPERYLLGPDGKPATIGGSFHWVRTQIQDELREKLGPDAEPPQAIDPVTRQVRALNARTPPVQFRLVAYSGTEAAIARRETPVYMITYQNPKTGVWNLMPQYFRPDVGKAMVTERERLAQDRADHMRGYEAIEADKRRRAGVGVQSFPSGEEAPEPPVGPP